MITTGCVDRSGGATVRAHIVGVNLRVRSLLGPSFTRRLGQDFVESDLSQDFGV